MLIQSGSSKYALSSFLNHEHQVPLSLRKELNVEVRQHIFILILATDKKTNHRGF
jgi:hypothetical protein